MASIKLVNPDRIVIVRKLIRHAHGPAVRTLRERHFTVFRAIYLNEFSGSTRKRLEAAPAGDYPEVKRFMVQYSDNSRDTYEVGGVAFYGALSRATAENDETTMEGVRVPYARREATIRPASQSLCDIVGTLADDTVALIGAIEKSEQVAGAIVNAYPTTRQLVAAWPEIEPLLPIAKTPVALPVVNRSELNAAFGLPVE